MSDDACPDCGGDLRLEEKFTVTGHDWREYRCVKCGKSVTEDHGTALWQLLHDDRESADVAERNETATPSDPQPAPDPISSDPAAPSAGKPRWWQFWKRH